MPTPPPPRPGAESSTYVLTDLIVPESGNVVVQVDTFADKAAANDVTIVYDSADPITTLTIEKFGDNDGQEDVIRIDLSEFSDDFTIILKNTGNTVQDQLYLEGLQSFTDNGDGTYSATYFGTDGELHSLEIQPEDAVVTPYFALDGTVTGTDGADTLAPGYADTQGDQVDGADGPDDLIVGGGGRDTILAGAGDDTIYGDYAGFAGWQSAKLPQNTYAGTPPGPESDAEVFAFSISDAVIDNKGKATLTVDKITPNKALAQDFTISFDATVDSLVELKIEKGGDADGSADIYRLDLAEFSDDFLLVIANEDSVDRLVFENVQTVAVNPDGTYRIGYVGSDNALHTLTVNNGDAQVDFYLEPTSPYFYDDTIDAGDGNDLVDGGFGDDSIRGGDGADTLFGGDGSDTIDGGAGDDVIEGDRTGPGQPLSETLTYSYAQNSNGGQAAHFGEQGLGTSNDPLLFIDGDTGTEVRYHDGDIVEYGFGQEVPAGTSITLIEGENGIEDEWVDVYVSFGTTDSNGDTLSATDGGVGYANAVTNGQAVLVYSGPSDQTIDIVLPINATHIQFVGVGSHGGWGEIEYTELINPLEPGDDSITGGDGNDSIGGGGGADILDGGADNDTLDGGAGDDTLAGGTGADSLFGGAGTDQLDGGAGDDVLDGGLGDDTILGGDGADTITGGDSTAAEAVDRIAFRWSAIPDPNDGGPIDNLDPISSGSQQVNSVTVDFATSAANTTFASTGVYAGGIDAGSNTVDTTSALSFDDTVTLDLSFSEPVTNVSFNIADFEVSSELITILAFDAAGQQIPITVVKGANVVGSNTDAVAGEDQFSSPASNQGDLAASNAIEVSIPGPVSDIQIIMASPGNGSLVMSDVWFDDPDTGVEAAGDDLLQGGADADTFVVVDNFGNDTIVGGETATTGTNFDTIDLSGTTVPLVVTFDGNKSGTITDGSSTITFTEIERIILGPEADVLDASFDGVGTEILGGGGDDQIIGGGGNDQIDGGLANDTLTGGAGDDTFVYSPGGGLDTITDFNSGNSGALGDGDPTNNDFIDLAPYYDHIDELRADFADDGILNQSNATTLSGAPVDYGDNSRFQSGDGIAFQGAAADGSDFKSDNTGVVCFTPGTRILTERGERPIELLRPGDRIVTRDNGLQVLQWIASRTLGPSELVNAPNLLPVRISPDLVGADAPLIVSPQHGLLVRLPDGDEALMRAIHLARLRGGKARVAKGTRRVRYIHLMFDAHQIVFANGAPSESFYPGPMALRALAEPARAELQSIFPAVFASTPKAAFGERARAFVVSKNLPKHESKILAATA